MTDFYQKPLKIMTSKILKCHNFSRTFHCKELNDQSLETVGKFCHLGDTIGSSEGAVDSVKVVAI